MIKVVTEDDKQFISTNCKFCQKEVKIEATDKQIEQYNSMELIQNVFPNATPGERETFISGMCGECFDTMFEI